MCIVEGKGLPVLMQRDAQSKSPFPIRSNQDYANCGIRWPKVDGQEGRGFDAPSSNLLNRFLICGKQQTLWDCCLVLDECCCDSKRRREVFCQRLLQPLSLSASTSKMNLVLRMSYSMYMTLFAGFSLSISAHGSKKYS